MGVLVFVGVVFGGLYVYESKQTYNAPKQQVETRSPEEVKASDIEKRVQEVKERPEHKDKVAKYNDLEALRVATSEYKKAEEEKYALIQSEIKKNEDIVKQSELSF